MALHSDVAVRKAWVAALPVAGVDGTLKARFLRERGRIQAKTGSLRQIHALAGYVDTLGGDRLAFAIYLNGYVGGDPKLSGRVELDRLVEVLAAYTGKL
jgi:D-alanyl-D-alanine carboxypeptidase/D-alanyl-D-alanine-endopeptidase (penicillin-binding protein 4)